MSTATRGTVLAGRYRLEERLQSNADGALWRAVDATLDRRISIRVMRPSHPFAADVADAARRAALVDDQRLVRVLDVGSDGEIGFVVSEDVDGDSLAALVERSPLAPPAVRRIIGEVAQGLDAAAARGLHHLCLTPRSVIVTRDGSVKIVGTAVEAAASGLEPAHAATASRDDAIALVGLLYSGLTGRWPLGNAGYPPAPRGEGGGPVPPADLVRGIPNDLDTICVVTLGGDDGPRSPAELARELAPWPTAAEAPLRAAPRRLPSDPPPAPLGPDSPLKIRSRPAGKRGGGFPSAKSAVPPVRPTAGPAASTGGATGADQAETDGSPPAATPRRSATMFPTSVALTGSLPIPKEPTGRGPRRMDSLFSAPAEKEAAAPVQPKDQPADRSAKDQAAATTPVRSSPAGAAARPTAAAGSGATAKADPQAKAKSGRTKLGRAKPADQPVQPTAPTPPSNSDSATDPLIPWGSHWSTGSNAGPGADSSVPFPILIPAETPPREQSRLVIFSITVVLVLGLLVAAFSLRDLGSNGNVEPAEIVPGATGSVGALAPTTAAPTAAASTEPAEPTATATSATPTPSTSVPVRIASIRAIDPEGDGDEDTASTPLAVDGNESTSWSSDTYRSSSFGGLKDGVGLSLKLKQSAPLASATIDVSGTGGVVEVRTASSPDVSSSQLVGRGTIKNGRVTVKTKSAKASRYVILWFTELPSVGGNYKVEVSEVRLK